MDSENEIRPQPGPQEAYLACPADICVYGGQAGGGKTFGALLDNGRWCNVPGFTGLVLRRNAVDLEGAGSIWDEAQVLYRKLGGHLREGKYLDCRWPSGAVVDFDHCQHEKDVIRKYQGKSFAVITLEEGTHFTEFQFWYLLSRNRSTCGVRPYMRITCNPDPDSFIRELIDWWIDEDGNPIPDRSGVLRWFVRQGDELVWGDSVAELRRKLPGIRKTAPRSLTFIPSRLEDNPALMNADPDYLEKLENMPRVERERLRGGNWDVRPAAGDYFQRGKLPIIDALPHDITWTVRAWDLAATSPSKSNPDPDWTRGVRMSGTKSGKVIIEDIVGLRGPPGDVEDLLEAVASQDGRKVPVGLWQDPASAGKAYAASLVKLLSGYDVRVEPASQNKEAYARPLSAQALHGNVFLLRGDWNEAFIREAERFPGPGHDDMIDAASLAFFLKPMPAKAGGKGVAKGGKFARDADRGRIGRKRRSW